MPLIESTNYLDSIISNKIAVVNTGTLYTITYSLDDLPKAVMTINYLSLTDWTIEFSEPEIAPTDIQLSNNEVSDIENIGFEVGTLTATDANISDTATFSIILDVDSKFAINGDKLELAAAIDAGVNESHDVTIRVTDSAGLIYDEIFTITVVAGADFSTSLTFNGVDEYIDYGLLNAMGAISSASLFMWVKDPDPSAPRVFEVAVAGTNSLRFVLASSNRTYIYISEDGSAWAKLAQFTNSLSGGGWNSLGFSYDASTDTLKCYVNGTLATYTGTDNAMTTGIKTASGSKVFVGNAAFSGNIDDVLFTNDVKTTLEFSDMHNNGVPKDLSGYSNIILYTRLGEETTAISQPSIVGNPGTLINMNETNISMDVPS